MADDRRPPLETPEADSLEQERPLDESNEDSSTEPLPEELEANPADVLDQRRELPDNDDDYPPGEPAG